MQNEPNATVNPYASTLPSPESPFVEHPSSQNNSVLCAMYAVYFFYGASQIFRYDGNETFFIATILMVVLAAIWTFVDSKLRGSRLNPALRVLYIITFPLSTFIYLAATRGIKGVGWWILNLIGLYMALVVGFYATFYGLYYSGHWDLMDPIFFQ